MADEGALTLRLVVGGGCVARVDLSSTRRTDFSKVLIGLPVEKALGLVPSLFSVCASAQAVAGLEACEAALGLEVDEGNRSLRRALVGLEAVDNHAFQFFVEWPRVVGLPPEIEAFRRVRGACQAVRAALVGQRSWAMLGGVAVEGRSVSAGGLRSAVEAAIPSPIRADSAALARWSPFLAAALDAGAREQGQGSTLLLPLHEAAWFGRRLKDAGFSAKPTVHGAPAEAGSLTFVESFPVMASELAQRGRTIWARLLAQVVNVHRLVDVVEAALADRAVASARGGSATESGEGAGIADTSRGRLAHAVWLEDGVVISWRTVAPTEWTFHPQGAVATAMVGRSEEAVARVVPFLVASLDPCVACALKR